MLVKLIVRNYSMMVYNLCRFVLVYIIVMCFLCVYNKIFIFLDFM